MLDKLTYILTYLNGTLNFEILHRYICAWTDGIGAAGLHVQRLEMAIYNKFRSGPFGKDSCHEQMVSTAKDLNRLFPSHQDLPWQLFYARCARNKGKHGDASFGTEEPR